MVVKADRCASPSMTIMEKGAITIMTKTDDQIHTKASYATYVASQIILHAIIGRTHRISMVVTTCMVVNVAELAKEVASTNSKVRLNMAADIQQPCRTITSNVEHYVAKKLTCRTRS